MADASTNPNGYRCVTRGTFFGNPFRVGMPTTDVPYAVVRRMNVEWARDLVSQCKAADVPVFVKQFGARPVDWRSNEPEVPPYEFFFSDRKGGDPSEWPKELQVRQFPSPARASA